VDTWRALIRLREEDRVASIGVSNFNAEQIQRLADETGVVPAVNQIELHPFFQQTALRAFHPQHGIVTEAWSPLGKARILEDRTLAAIAAKHGKTPAQVVLRWHLQKRRRRHSEIGDAGAHSREFRCLRLRAGQRGHGEDRKPGQQERPHRPRSGTLSGLDLDDLLRTVDVRWLRPVPSPVVSLYGERQAFAVGRGTG
jgi:hypothetical protein